MRARITHPQVDYDGQRYVEGDVIDDDNGAEKLSRWGYAVLLDDETGEPPAVPEVVEAYDPSTGTIVDVERYVEAHPEAFDAVYQAEVDGKNRSTLLASLDARRPATTDTQEG